MRQEVRIYAAQGDTDLPQPYRDATANVKHQPLVAGFHQRALTEAIRTWVGNT